VKTKTKIILRIRAPHVVEVAVARGPRRSLGSSLAAEG
jgi:hypothetical protein